ncbi:MAG: hypothetical protein ACJAZO_002537 [Myxococcota bacterium]|jgi:hypothetical protein
MMQWQRGDTTVRWIQGGLWVQHQHVGLVVDAPLGCCDALQDKLPIVQTIALTSGRIASLRGLLALLEGVSSARRHPLGLTVLGPMADERAPALVDAWSRGWRNRCPVQIDGIAPGDGAECGPMTVQLAPVRHAEPNGQFPLGIDDAHGCAAIITTPDARIVWVPGAAPSNAVRRCCRGADLAVVEVGVTPWPDDTTQWRLTLQDALAASDDVGELWVVGDDGHPLSAADA